MPFIENETYKLEFNPDTGAIETLFTKPMGEDILGEKRLATPFNLRLQHTDFECDYATENKPASMDISGCKAEIYFDRVNTQRGEHPVRLHLWIELDGKALRFRSRLENQCEVPVAEFWYPCLGGITRFGERSDTEVFWPGYVGSHYSDHIERFPTHMPLGNHYPESVMGPCSHPFPTMPWFDIHNRNTNTGLYFGYHDPIYRIHLSRFGYYPCVGRTVPGDNWPRAEDLGREEPTGIVFSHIRFPYVSKDDPKVGDTYEHGEFVVHYHDGDWHDAAPIYRSWWDQHFSMPKEPSWLRRRSVWFTAMLQQPEDRINVDYEGFTQWAKDGKEFGINTVEICAWDMGGQDRDYPIYDPSPRLGGEEGFRKMLKDLAEAEIDPIIFANYNAVNYETDWYREELHKYARMDEFGNCENWLAWGQSTITARHKLSVRRQLWASASIPAFNEIIANYFIRLAKWGVKAMQLDKTGSSEQLLDFNPLATMPPDTSMAEGTVRACEWLLEKCKAIQPDFCVATEANADRYLPYSEVFYRGAFIDSVPPMRYVFPEWTSCIHLRYPTEYAAVNAAVRFGCVLVVEPLAYTAGPAHPWFKKIMSYIKEINRLREALIDDLFLSRWLDNLGAELVWNDQRIRGRAVSNAQDIGGITLMREELPIADANAPLVCSVHENLKNGRRTIVVVNNSHDAQHYQWVFTHKQISEATLYAPFDEPRSVSSSDQLTLKGERLHIIVEA